MQLPCAVPKTETIQCGIEIVSPLHKISPRSLKISHTLPKSIFCLPLPLPFFSKVNNFYVKGKKTQFIYIPPWFKKKLRWLTKIHNINLKLWEGDEVKGDREGKGGTWGITMEPNAHSEALYTGDM